MFRTGSTLSIFNRAIAVLIILASLYLLLLYKLAPSPSSPTASPNTFLNSHESHDHVDLVATDEIIIVLGHKLYNDGMPARLLKDRVARAVQLYKDMMNHGHHPLIILSGKGKSDEIGYTEAEVMLELSLCMHARAGDVLIDGNSTNTAQNAKFSSSLIEDNHAIAIEEVYVVTSDYHMPRAQYIFQSVFPTNIRLAFVSSETSENKRAEEVSREKTLMRSSQQDLIREGILDADDTSGNHPLQNYPRWMMIERELESDARHLTQTQKGKSTPPLVPVVVAEYGDINGYVSLLLARRFPDGEVISLQRADDVYSHSFQNHASKITQDNIQNNLLCRLPPSLGIFAQLVDTEQIYTYQICLDVVQWLAPARTQAEFDSALANFLYGARSTFLEMPDVQDVQVQQWYGTRNETEIFESIAKQFNLTYKFLGPILHPTGMVGKVFRVDLPDAHPNLDVDLALDIYACKELVGGGNITEDSLS